MVNGSEQNEHILGGGYPTSMDRNRMSIYCMGGGGGYTTSMDRNRMSIYWGGGVCYVNGSKQNEHFYFLYQQTRALMCYTRVVSKSRIKVLTTSFPGSRNEVEVLIYRARLIDLSIFPHKTFFRN